MYPSTFKIGETSLVAYSPISPSEMDFDEEEAPSAAPSAPSPAPFSFSSQPLLAPSASPPSIAVPSQVRTQPTPSHTLTPSHLIVFNETYKENARPLNASRGAVFPHSLFVRCLFFTILLLLIPEFPSSASLGCERDDSFPFDECDYALSASHCSTCQRSSH